MTDERCTCWDEPGTINCPVHGIAALPPVPSEPLLCLSIRQPWAHMILHQGKDIENRTWPTKVRGRILIHASKGMIRDEWEDAWSFALFGGPAADYNLVPDFRKIERGGIVGSVEIVDCVQHSNSPWFRGPWGFVLRDPQPLAFTACRGALGFFRYNATHDGRRKDTP